MNHFFPILCELFLKSFAVLALAAGVNTCWRGASAASRHLIWMLAVASLLALPLSKIVEPIWTVRLDRVETTPLPRAPEPILLPAHSSPAELQLAPQESWKLPSWYTLLTIGWLAGVFAAFGYRISGELRLERLRRRSEPLSDQHVQAMARSIATEYGISARTEFRCTSESAVPLTWGIWKPVVLLPKAALGWPEQRLAMALRHELAHVQRRDCLTRSLASLAGAFYWPNPLIWLAARRLRLDQEHACDDLVLLGGASSSRYADLLVQTARSLQGNRPSGRDALAMAQPSILEARVRAIVDGKRNRAPMARGATVRGAASVAMLLAASALAQVVDQSPAQGPQIEIESKFVELSDDALKQAGAEWLRAPQSGIGGVVTGQQLEKLLAALARSKGVDILANPRVITNPKQQAKIEVCREFSFPTEWEKDKEPGTWKPKTFAKKNVGVSLKVEAAIMANGNLELNLQPEMVKFLGFRDLDNANKTLSPTQEQMQAGHRFEPVFSTREIRTVMQTKSEETVVLGGFVKETNQKEIGLIGAGKESQSLFVFVTAKLLKPIVPEEPVTITSDHLSYDKPSGKVTATGNVRIETPLRIETPRMVIQTDKAVMNPKPGGTLAPENAMQWAGKVIIPRLEFMETSLNDALAYLRQQAASHKPPVNIVLLPEARRDVKITLTLREVPLSEALGYVIELSGNELVWTEEAAVVRKRGSGDGQPKPAEAPVTEVTKRSS